MMTCRCGKPATHAAYLPVPNIYAGLRQVTEPEPVCDYHAEKAKVEGYRVDKINEV